MKITKLLISGLLAVKVLSGCFMPKNNHEKEESDVKPDLGDELKELELMIQKMPNTIEIYDTQDRDEYGNPKKKTILNFKKSQIAEIARGYVDNVGDVKEVFEDLQGRKTKWEELNKELQSPKLVLPAYKSCIKFFQSKQTNKEHDNLFSSMENHCLDFEDNSKDCCYRKFDFTKYKNASFKWVPKKIEWRRV